MSKEIRPSEEQQAIIRAVSDGQNVIVNAVAGSGKTTTILFCAAALPEQRILHLTYNKHLQLDAKAKCDEWQLNNLDIMTLHGFCRKFYNDLMGDEALLNALGENSAPKRLIDYDIIFVDECQDLNMTFFHFVRKIMNDFEIKQIVMLGDVWQTVYRFKGSDERFMILADKIFSQEGSQTTFVRLPLNYSFRLTKQMAEFVNHVSGCKIRSNRNGPMVYYGQPGILRIFGMICDLLKQYKPDDIFILSTSTRQDYTLKELENKLVEKKIPVFVPDDEQHLRPEVVQGKLIITTFHQAKGRERPVVLLAPFGARYYEQTKSDPDYLTEALYVGITRAKEKLYLFTDWGMSRALPVNYIGNFVDLPSVFIEPELKKKFKPSQTSKTPYTVINPSEFSRHLPKDLIEYVLNLRDIMFDQQWVEEQTEIETNELVESTVGGSAEQIADINGIAIPFFHLMKYPQFIGQFDKETIKAIQPLLTPLGGKFPPQTTADCLKIALCLWSLNSGLKFKMEQIRHFDWMYDDIADAIVSRFMTFHTSDIEFEVERSLVIRGICTRELRYSGILDAVNKHFIYEYKFVDQLNAEHFLQVMLYAYAEVLFCRAKKIKPVRRFVLINFRKNEVYHLFDLNNANNVAMLDKHIRHIILRKLEPQRLDDDQFIKEALKGPKPIEKVSYEAANVPLDLDILNMMDSLDETPSNVPETDEYEMADGQSKEQIDYEKIQNALTTFQPRHLDRMSALKLNCQLGDLVPQDNTKVYFDLEFHWDEVSKTHLVDNACFLAAKDEIIFVLDIFVKYPGQQKDIYRFNALDERIIQQYGVDKETACYVIQWFFGIISGVEALHWCGNDGKILQDWLGFSVPVKFVDLEPQLRHVIGAKTKSGAVKRASLDEARRKYGISQSPKHLAYDDTLVLYQIARLCKL